MKEKYTNYHINARDSYGEKMNIQVEKDSENQTQMRENFDIDVEPEKKEIFPRTIFEKGVLCLKDGQSVNFFDVSFPVDSSSLEIDIDSREIPLPVRRLLINDSESISVINGGFFFLADKFYREPASSHYNLCVRGSAVIGLPVVDRPALITCNGELTVKECVARGTIKIGEDIYSWRDNRSALAGSENGTLYNSASCTIEHRKDETGVTFREVVQEKNFTPKNEDVVDVVFGLDDETLRVMSIHEGGGTDFFAGSAILQLNTKSCNIKIGDVVSPELLDGVDLKKIQSAITIGPNALHFLDNDDHEINHDLSLGSHAPFSNTRKAHSVLFLDNLVMVHFRVFDGVPKSKSHTGITPYEVALEMKHLQVLWAYHLDGGQSSQIGIKSKDATPEIYGSLHYLRYPKTTLQPVVWSGERKNFSAIVLKRKDS